MYENGTILYMTCNGQVIYRGRKIITHCGIENPNNNMELSKQKGSGSYATISQVLGNINEATDSGGPFTENVQK